MKSNETIVKSVRMQSALAIAIKKVADKENRNFSNMVETILLKHFRDTTKKPAIT